MSSRQVAAILTIGVIGVLIPGLQPQLLGALAAEGRVSVAALGTLATAELLAMGVAAGGAGFILSVQRLRPIAAAALVVIAAADLLTPRVPNGLLLTVRGVAGLGEGVLVWLAIAFIVRTARPERWSGIYLAVQTLAQLAMASVFGYLAAGSATGFGLLALVTLAGLLAVASLPRGFAPLVDATGVKRPSARGLVALGGVLLYLGFVVSVWVYVEPLALARGVPPRIVHLVTPVSLAMQVLGALAATLLAGRTGAASVLATGAAANLALLALLGTAASPTAFVFAAAAFGFLWLFVMPFQVPLVIAADPTRRAAMLVGGAQLIGSSAGPLIAGIAVDATGLAAVLWAGGAMVIAGAALLIGAGRAA